MTATKKTATKKAAAPKKKAATSGNPAKRAAAAQASSVSDFKKLKKGHSLELPSGLTVVARRVSLGAFIKKGEVPNALLEIIQEALSKGQQADIAAMVGVEGEDGSVDLDMVKDMFETVESVVMEMVSQPKIHPLPTEDEDQQPIDPTDTEAIEEAKSDDKVYIDEIDEEDKMFLFQWATGGTSDVATFREEASTSLAAVAEGKKLRSPAKPTDRARKR